LTSGDLASSYTWRLFPQIEAKVPNAADHFQKLEDFHRRARGGQLPRFSYIEPYWSISHTSNPGLQQFFSVSGNDYHPPSNMLVGEQFVKDVYTSLIANRDAWSKTLLIITFDEFVGSFDHVTDRGCRAALGTKRHAPQDDFHVRSSGRPRSGDPGIALHAKRNGLSFGRHCPVRPYVGHCHHAQVARSRESPW
jgi:phospholipase C